MNSLTDEGLSSGNGSSVGLSVFSRHHFFLFFSKKHPNTDMVFSEVMPILSHIFMLHFFPSDFFTIQCFYTLDLMAVLLIQIKYFLYSRLTIFFSLLLSAQVPKTHTRQKKAVK